jgi:hypothetical protein
MNGKHKDKAPARGLEMQDRDPPTSVVSSVMAEPLSMDGPDVTSSTQSSDFQTTTIPDPRRSRTRFDTEEGGHAAAHSDGSITVLIQTPYHERYYFDYGKTLCKDGPNVWEDELYKQWPFRLALLVVLLGSFTVWTCLALLL